MNHDCTKLREQLNNIKQQMSVKRLHYIRLMRKKYDKLPKSEKMPFLGMIPERMRAMGMYSVHTLGMDIQSIIVRRWYRDEVIEKDWRRGFDTWNNWLRDNGIDWAKARLEWRKAVGLVVV